MAVEGRKRGQQTDSAWCQVNYVARALVPAIWILITMQPTTQARSAADDEKVVEALDVEYQAAVKKNDVATMDRILADDFVLVTGLGKTYTKADLLEEARSKRTVYEHQQDSARKVRVWGDTAVVTALLWAKGTEDGYKLWLATPMFGLRLAGAMSLPRPRPVCRRRLEFGVTVDV
jgi:ketosteroid isomerase-like protein